MPANMPKIPRCVFPDYPRGRFFRWNQRYATVVNVQASANKGRAFPPCISVSPAVEGFVRSALVYDIFLSSVAEDADAAEELRRLDESIRNSTLRTECDRGAESLPTLREALP